MSVKLIQKANPVVGVAVGKTSLCDLLIGPSYHVIWLVLTGVPATPQTTVALADVLTAVRVKTNGKVARDHTVGQLDAIQGLYQASMVSQIYNMTDGNTTPGANKTMTFRVPIWFADPSRKSLADQERTAWPTMWTDSSSATGTTSQLRSLQLELDHPNTGNLAASGLSVEVWAETTTDVGSYTDYTDSTGAKSRIPNDYILSWSQLSLPYAANGELQIVTLDKNFLLGGLHLFTNAAATISNLKLNVNGVILRDVTKLMNDAVLLGRGYNAGYMGAQQFNMIPDYTDVPTDMLNLKGASQFTVTPTLAGVNAEAKMLSLVRIDWRRMP